MSTNAITPHGGPGLRVAEPVEVVGVPAALQPLIDGAPFACSPTVGAIGGALAAAQAVMQNAEKDKTAVVKMRNGGTFEYKYADLASVLDAVRRPLGEHGIAVVQLPLMKDRTVTVVTILIHASGEWIGSRLSAPAEDEGRMTPVQAVGTIISYLRRYALTAISAAAGEDNDGAENNAGAPGPRGAARPLDPSAGKVIRKKADSVMHLLTPDQAAAVNAALEAAPDITTLRRVERKLDATLKANQPPPPATTTAEPPQATAEAPQATSAAPVPDVEPGPDPQEAAATGQVDAEQPEIW